MTAGESPEPGARRPYAHAGLSGEVLHFSTLDSTNVALRTLAERGAPEGTVVVAAEQTAGRGRLGRAWRSPAGAGFYGSVLLRPRIAPVDAQVLTLLSAVAAAEAIAGLGMPEVEIKWPNDVLARGRKICGILCETGLVGASLEWAVVGIGINLTDDAVPPDAVAPATSFAHEGVVTTTDAVTDALLEALGRWYARLRAGGASPVLSRWLELAPMASGRTVTVRMSDDCFEARTDGIAPDGRLRVVRDGAVVLLSAADVSLTRTPENQPRRLEGDEERQSCSS